MKILCLMRDLDCMVVNFEKVYPRTLAVSIPCSTALFD